MIRIENVSVDVHDSSSMDLASIIARKKKVLSTTPKDPNSKGKWVRRSDVLEIEDRERREKEIEIEKRKRARIVDSNLESSDELERERSEVSHAKRSKTDEKLFIDSNQVEKKCSIPVSEIIRRLRLISEPIIYFGETDYEREQRVYRLESEMGEEKLTKQGQQNELQAALSTTSTTSSSVVEDTPEAEELRKRGEEKERIQNAFPLESRSAEKLIFFFIKDILKLWENSLSSRPEEEALSVRGKLDTASFHRVKSDLHPLFEKLIARDLPRDIRTELVSMVKSCQKRDYVAAIDSYMKIAIGNAPWPMGVTMVGIHERSGREKISVNNVAHVLNDETTRKYLQAMKRIVTFCQKVKPTDPSKSVN